MVRIERSGSEWVLVDGRAPSEARWRLSGSGSGSGSGRGEEVEIVSPSGRAYVVPSGDVPFDVALGLLALRDAARFLSSTTGESAGAVRAARVAGDVARSAARGSHRAGRQDAIVDGLPVHILDGDLARLG